MIWLEIDHGLEGLYTAQHLEDKLSVLVSEILI